MSPLQTPRYRHPGPARAAASRPGQEVDIFLEGVQAGVEVVEPEGQAHGGGYLPGCSGEVGGGQSLQWV